jgi:hypothetical protein
MKTLNKYIIIHFMSTRKLKQDCRFKKNINEHLRCRKTTDLKKY